ncbi:Uncharacterized protein Fot_13549 [Forsythia ovata]|uniref:Uncharacterized protein n=1 Tax=Forsythia ovata TaxID=205694 RepID=A0ABD1W3V1_9LAMI
MGSNTRLDDIARDRFAFGISFSPWVVNSCLRLDDVWARLPLKQLGVCRADNFDIWGPPRRFDFKWYIPKGPSLIHVFDDHDGSTMKTSKGTGRICSAATATAPKGNMLRMNKPEYSVELVNPASWLDV